MNASLVDQYAAGPEQLSLAIRGLTEEDLNWVPPADAAPELGRWSIRQIVVHLCDAEMAFADRIKRIIAEDEPVLQAWSESRFVERLFYDAQSAADAMTIIEATRRQVTRILRKVDPSAYQRTGQHSERGRQNVNDVLGYAVRHIDHHVKFIHAKRAAMGKEMW